MTLSEEQRDQVKGYLSLIAVTPKSLLAQLLAGMELAVRDLSAERDRLSEELEESRANARHLARRLIRGMEVAANIDVLIEYEKEAFRQGNRETEEAVGPLMQVRDHLRTAQAVEHQDSEEESYANEADLRTTEDAAHRASARRRCDDALTEADLRKHASVPGPPNPPRVPRDEDEQGRRLWGRFDNVPNPDDDEAVQPPALGHVSPQCVDGDVPGEDCDCPEGQ